MKRGAVMIAAFMCVSSACHAAPKALSLVPYAQLPRDVRDYIPDAVSDTCDADPATARKEARNVHVYRGDVNSDGFDDYVLDEWSIKCTGSLTHVVDVWWGKRGGGLTFEQHVEASLVRGPNGFGWVQGRCLPGNPDHAEIETYRGRKVEVSKCLSGKQVQSEMRTRGLVFEPLN
jgi:hypothetical protein